MNVAPGFSKRVKEVLARYNGSVNALFKATKVQRATLVSWKNAKDDIEPQESSLRKFLEGTGVSEEWLIDGRGEMGTPNPVPNPPRKRLTSAEQEKSIDLRTHDPAPPPKSSAEEKLMKAAQIISNEGNAEELSAYAEILTAGATLILRREGKKRGRAQRVYRAGEE